jgi:S-formylglutathione hydrolase FrmB
MHGRCAVILARPLRRVMVAVALGSAVASAQATAGRPVRSLTFWSQSLGATKRALVWLPPSYDSQPTRRYPVAYYLHGLFGNESDWTSHGRLAATLDSLVRAGAREFIVVMPDGDDGWYTTWNTLGDYAACRRDYQPRDGETADTYCVPWLHYDDYIARDLVRVVDSTFRTRADRRSRAVAGLSMGGYGAVMLALSYPDVFGAAASHSGVLSPLFVGRRPNGQPRYASTLAEVRPGFGDLYRMIAPAFGTDLAAWWSRDPARRAAQAVRRDRAGLPALLLDVGASDELLEQNRAFRTELARLGVPHTYTERPGKHDWDYWRVSALASLRWIAERFDDPPPRR